MCDCTKKDDKPKGNVWLARLGFVLLMFGMFPEIVGIYPEKSFLVIKWVIIFAAAAYVINLAKNFIKSFF